MDNMRQIEKAEALTASEAVLKFGLNWNVAEKRVNIGAPNDGEFKAIVHGDTGAIFQFAKKGYLPIQNLELFQTGDKLTGTGQAKYVQGGSYKGGKIVWLRLRVPGGDFEPVPGDKHSTYLRMVSSHDGSSKFMIYPEIWRMVCTNGMHAFTRDYEKTVAVKHTVNAHTIMDLRASEVLAKELKYFRKFAEASREMARKQMNQLEVETFLQELFDVRDKEIKGKTKAQIERVTELCQTGQGIREFNLQGTAYGVYNAVTEYIGKYRPTRGDAENREFSEAFGSGKQMREKAFELLKA